MKRTLITGILSANIVAAGPIAQGATQVYTQNVGNFFSPETNFTDVASMICKVGPFVVGESHYWTDAAGHRLNGPHTTNAPIRSSTYFILGKVSTTVPLSPRSLVIFAAGILLTFGAILSAVLLKKSRRT
jgi:hypothetical protein